MAERTVAVLSAGLGQPSSTRMLADKLGAAARDAFAVHDAELALQPVELRDHAHDLANNLLTGFPAPALAEAIRTVVDADGLIAVTPTFTASYSGLFKTFFDVLDDGVLGGKPVLIAATAGTPRHALVLEHAMRPMFAYLHAVVVPTAVFAAAEDWDAGESAGDALGARIDRSASEFAALVCGAGSHTRAPDPFESPTPFEELLDGV